jgi:hypothetical protein
MKIFEEIEVSTNKGRILLEKDDNIKILREYNNINFLHFNNSNIINIETNILEDGKIDRVTIITTKGRIELFSRVDDISNISWILPEFDYNLKENK